MKGEYGLEVYGNDPAKDGDTYTHVCQYFVHFAPPEEQAKAFYQETPNRMRYTPDGRPVANAYNPDTQSVCKTSVSCNSHTIFPILSGFEWKKFLSLKNVQSY